MEGFVIESLSVNMSSIKRKLSDSESEYEDLADLADWL